MSGITSQRPLTVLIDTGSTRRSFIYRSALPAQCEPMPTQDYNTTLLDMNTSINKKVTLEDIVLLEFNSTHHISQPFSMLVAESEATSFDIILGQDFNIALGLNVLNTWKVVSWMGDEVPFRISLNRNKRFIEIQQQYINSFANDKEVEHLCVSEVFSADYHKIDTDAVADAQEHLSLSKRK